MSVQFKCSLGSRFVVIAIAACVASPATADNHLTVDTSTGHQGDKITIKAGYYFSESDYAIQWGRLLKSGEIVTYEVSTPLAGSGDSTGWFSGFELLVTSDFYFASGRLSGGNFQYELASINALSGGHGEAAWGDFDDEGGVEPFGAIALSGGATRLGRSFDVGIGGHDELQGYAFSAPGLYDVTFIAWDSNGVYADSDPLTVRFNVIPASPSISAMTFLVPILGRRRRRS